MKILHCVENYFPSKGGMQEVVKQLSERLCAMGHEVLVVTRTNQNRSLTELNGVKIFSFNVNGNFAGGMTGEIEEYRKFLLSFDGDVITFFAAQQFTTDAALDILPSIRAKKVSVPTGYSGFYDEHYRTYYQKMQNWIHQYDMNVYLSDDYRDINFARKCGVKKLLLIPNGADEQEFNKLSEIDVRQKFNIPADYTLILHVGSYTGRKGHLEALEIFFSSKLNKTCLLMIGDHVDYFKRRSVFKFPDILLKWISSKFSDKRIVMTEADRETTIAAYQQSDVFFFPSQIECSPIVLFEASAAGLPFLTSSAGNAPEIISWTNGGLLLQGHKDHLGNWHPNVKDCALQLKNLISNHELRSELAKKGKQAWASGFTWQNIARQYEQMYKSLIQSDGCS